MHGVPLTRLVHVKGSVPTIRFNVTDLENSQSIHSTGKLGQRDVLPDDNRRLPSTVDSIKSQADRIDEDSQNLSR